MTYLEKQKFILWKHDRFHLVNGGTAYYFRLCLQNDFVLGLLCTSAHSFAHFHCTI